MTIRVLHWIEFLNNFWRSLYKEHLWQVSSTFAQKCWHIVLRGAKDLPCMTNNEVWPNKHTDRVVSILFSVGSNRKYISNTNNTTKLHPQTKATFIVHKMIHSFTMSLRNWNFPSLEKNIGTAEKDCTGYIYCCYGWSSVPSDEFQGPLSHYLCELKIFMLRFNFKMLRSKIRTIEFAYNNNIYM